MKHESLMRYPAPAAVVMRMFSDGAFHRRKLAQVGLSHYAVLEEAKDDAQFRIRIERHVPLDVPGVLKKVVPASTRVINDETWDLQRRSGRVSVEPQGIPVSLACSTSMRDEGKGCVVVYAWEVKARVPLIGGALEKFVIADTERHAQRETEIAIGLLEAYR